MIFGRYPKNIMEFKGRFSIGPSAEVKEEKTEEGGCSGRRPCEIYFQ